MVITRVLTLAAGLLLVGGLTARAALVNGVKSVVNDSVVTYEQVERLTQQTSDVLVREYRSQPDELRKRLDKVRGENLDKLIERELILHEFKTAGYALPDSVIEDLVRERIKTRFGDRRSAARTLQADGITFEKFRQQVREQFIVEALRQKNISSEIIISPFKIQRYYDDNPDKFKLGEQVKLRLIVLAARDNKEEVRKLGQDILAKLKEGVPFAEMAGIHSQTSERNVGGERPLQELRELRPELGEAVRATAVGEVTGLVDAGDAFMIAKVEQKLPAHVKPLSAVREEIEKDLQLQERNRIERDWIAKLRKKTFVKYF